MVIVKEDNKREKNYPSVSLFHYGVMQICTCTEIAQS
jgi:hypothetical protein